MGSAAHIHELLVTSKRPRNQKMLSPVEMLGSLGVVGHREPKPQTATRPDAKKTYPEPNG